jgi:hypothetical protein
MRSNAALLFVRVAKVFGGCPVLPEERFIKTSILVQCIIDLQSISLLNLLGVSKTVEIGAA